MAASFITKSAIHFGTGFPQRIMEIGTVTFDTDATVEVGKSNLNHVTGERISDLLISSI